MSFVYVSCAEDGDICAYTLKPDGSLQVGARVPAGKMVMPLATSPDRRFLYACVRSKPFSAHTFSIDAGSGALTHLSSGPLAESFAYISTDRTGRHLFGASYGGNVVSVNPIGNGGQVGDPQQVTPVERHAHSIRVDNSNRYVFVPALGSDQVFQFTFDAQTGSFAPNTPPSVHLKAGSGPRHVAISPDNRFAYVLNEMAGTVTAFTLDAQSGCLTEQGSVSSLPPDTPLRPGVPRSAPAPGQAPRNVDNDIWCSDLHMTPNGRFMYAAERTTSTLSTLGVDAGSGRLTYLGSAPTEKQPRGFAIDASGKFLVACGEKSETISVYSIDPATGALALLEKYPTGKGANWVEIVSP